MKPNNLFTNLIFTINNNQIQINKSMDEIIDLLNISKFKIYLYIEIFKFIINDIKLNNIKYLDVKFYSVGGINRDFFLDKESKDLDIVITNFLSKLFGETYISEFSKFMTLFEKYGHISNNIQNKESECNKFITYKFVPNIIDNSGNSFKKIFTDLNFEPIDIVSARIDNMTGKIGYHESFDPFYSSELTILDDLYRRDFLINAIAQDLENNEIIFPKNYTIVDINFCFEHKILSAINYINLIIDPTRMLRSIQLCGRLDFYIEENTYKIIKKYSNFIKYSKNEKIEQELIKLCNKSTNLKKGLIYFIHSGLFFLLFEYDSPHFNYLNNEDLNIIIHDINNIKNTSNKTYVSLIDCNILFSNPLFNIILENENLYLLEKENMFEIIIGILSFILLGENKDINIYDIIKRRITRNTNSLEIIKYIIKLMELIFNNQTTAININNFFSDIYSNKKIKINKEIFGYLIYIYNPELYSETLIYFNQIESYIHDYLDIEIVNINKLTKNIKNICSLIVFNDREFLILNQCEIKNSIKNIMFNYDKFIHPNKKNINNGIIKEWSKDINNINKIDIMIDKYMASIINNKIINNINNIIFDIMTESLNPI
jgi:tRNA nucleotidyltransferase/poly(A) polymerase